MSDLEKHLNFCWKVLPDVSRSFALCIKMLPTPADSHVMMSYLVLRIVDTIEDSNATLEVKEKTFAKFLPLLEGDKSSEDMVAECREALLNEIDHTYEHELLDQVNSVVEVFYSFPQGVREAIFDCASEMAKGMLKFQTQPVTDFKLNEEYCYYVAGVVGVLDNRIFCLNGHVSEELDKKLLPHSAGFGIGLQKVNVLRDVAYDIPMERLFWPSELLEKYGLSYNTLCDENNRPAAMKVLNEMVANALPYLDNAVNYICLLPRLERKIRIFCMIPLFMAIKSYAKCVGNENVFIKGKKVKIDRGEVQKVTRNSILFASSNWAIKRWYKSCLKDVEDQLRSQI